MFNLDEKTVTAEFLRRIQQTPSPRVREIIASMAIHLHDFARDVKLTEEEWLEGIKFLTLDRADLERDPSGDDPAIGRTSRGLSQLVVAQNHSRPDGVTEQTVFGPFHVEGAPKLPSRGADISTGYLGDPLFVNGRVVDGEGNAVAGATVDVWQADTEGYYDVQKPDWQLDEAKLRAVFETDATGSFTFRSIMPASYPIPMDGPVGDLMRAH